MVSKSQNPRKVAVDILNNVLYKKKSLKYLFTEKLLSNFKDIDKAFLTEIIYGVLRNLYYIDWLLEVFFKDKEKLSPFTINNLRIAIYQLIFMRVPDYAAVNEAVNIEKIFGGKPTVVNGILRNFLRKYSKGSAPECQNLSIKYSHPQWLIDRWIKRFGVEETKNILKANNEKPPFTIAVKPQERGAVIDYLTKKGFLAKATSYSPAAVTIEGQIQNILKTLHESPFFWIVQDEASQLVCFLLEPKEGISVLDLCASPGGKTILTAVLMERGKILSIEKDKGRFKTLKDNILRVKKFLPKVEIEAHLIDLFKLNIKESFDGIILDAPCSSTGVIRRNPDVRYRITEEEIFRLSNIQMKMLEKASKFLKRDGILIYSVCSTEPEEGEFLVDKFLQKHKEFITINSVYPFFESFYLKKGILRSFPHKHGTDGFFMVRLSLR
ncbi:MAG: 16S rRNA (cytosine(967)-C(5))-methyltransferase RsmB [Thermodesulfovibrionaceae bacterium]